ncbi:MAG TPA: tetratricopeptide repeat protein, partial [Candidatus Acidoferrum sp.]|nr:tetratricopeptide repeat protein [Candidatus Acidoferrum sp.]
MPSTFPSIIVPGPRSPVLLLILGLGIPALSSTLPWARLEQHGAKSASHAAQKETQADLNKLLEAARAARASGDPHRVAEANRKVIALALRELAQLRYLEGSLPQAIELYQRSLDFADEPGTHVDLAIALVAANQPDAAIAQANGVLASSPDDIRALTVLGRARILKQDYTGAAQPLSRVAALQPSLESLYTLAVCLLNSHDPQDNVRATRVLDQMIRLVGDSGSIHVIIGRAYRDASDLPAAIREFQRAIAVDPKTPHAHYFLGLARLASNEWVPTPEVHQEFAKELEIDPHDYLANYMTGFIDSSERKYAEAEPFLKQASQLNPGAPEPWLYIGLNAYALGQMQPAEAALRKAILLSGSDESRNNYQIRRAYIDLGRLLLTSGRKQEAEKYLTKARDLQNKVLELTQQQVGSHLLEGGAGAAAVVLPLSSSAEKQAVPISASSLDLFAQVDPSTLAQSNLTESQKHAAQVQEKTLRSVLALSFNDLATSEAVAKIYRS